LGVRSGHSGVEKRQPGRFSGTSAICGGETWAPAPDGVALYSAADRPLDGPDGLRAVSMAETWHGFLRPSPEAIPDLERTLAVVYPMARGGGAKGSGSWRNGAARRRFRSLGS